MTTTTRWRGPETLRSRPRRRAAFTLVEVLIGATLGTFILAGVLSTFLFLGRSAANVQNYSDMETEARRALEQFAQDTRQASAITWISDVKLTLIVDSVAITYSYESVTESDGEVTYSFFRENPYVPATEANPAIPATKRALLKRITVFNFKAYTITGAEITGIGSSTTLAAAGQTTKQLQISLQASRKSKTVIAATNTVLSARFILRNKRVTA